MKKITTAKKTTKTANKVKPLFKVDLTECETIEDLIMAFIEGKAEGNIAITSNELEFYAKTILREYIDFQFAAQMDFLNHMIVVNVKKPKKTPWYKKLMFWKKNK